jgi:hypothetical protein
MCLLSNYGKRSFNRINSAAAALRKSKDATVQTSQFRLGQTCSLVIEGSERGSKSCHRHSPCVFCCFVFCRATQREADSVFGNIKRAFCKCFCDSIL